VPVGQQADIDDGKGLEGALTTAGKEEMRRLMRELRRITMERYFLNKPAAYFAKETEDSK
jgi:transposase